MNNIPYKILDILRENSDNWLNANVDIVAMSCARQRLGEKTYYPWPDTRLENDINVEDLAKASAIRKHYGELIICEQLKGRNLTEFRKELSLVIASDGLKYKERWKGILFKLPYFYDYDLELQNLKETVFTNSHEHSPTLPINDAILTPVKRLFRNVKHCNKYSYFFEIEDSGIAAKININKDNPMLDMWEHLFNQRKPMHISGNFNWTSDQNLYSYLIKNFKIVNLQLG